MTKSGIEEQRNRFRKSCPALFEALIDERDLFMTHVLNLILEIRSRAKFTGKAVFYSDFHISSGFTPSGESDGCCRQFLSRIFDT